MDLTCYLHQGWKPRIRPAAATRTWMDNSPEGFAYRCLPLNIANAHGWEILSPAGFSAYWQGGMAPDDVIIQLDPDTPEDEAPVALFGQATLTFHIAGIFRTPPGWNLFVSGSPNEHKDGIAPLSGVIETDWSPYTFTMNWRFTRRNHWVRFEKDEPICFVFPVQRGVLDTIEPKFVSLEDDPELLRQFTDWSKSRNQFREQVEKSPPATTAEKWQKRYYRGQDMNDKAGTRNHQAKLRLREFTHVKPPEVTD